ncbi:MAG: protein kinase [Pseudomonadota bacterium]
MEIDLKRKDHLFQTAFPHPIAAPYRMVVSAHNPVERLAHVVATVDGLSRYLATVMITDLLRQSPDAAVVRDLVERMRVATIGGWIAIVEEILMSRPDADWFMKPVTSRLLRGGGKPSKALKALRKLADTAGALFEDRSIHNPQKAAEVLAELEPELQSCLTPLSFLSEYALGMMRTQAGSAEDPLFHGTFNRWMGHRPVPLPISVTLDSEPPLDAMLVVSPEFNRALVLHPFAEVRGEAEAQRLFLLSGMHSGSSMRMSSYTGRQIGATALEVEGVAVDLPEWLGAWTQGATMSVLTPSSDTVARMRTRSRLLPDEKLFDGAYTNLGFIGRGGIGAVYRLVEGESGEDRAIKILYPDLGRNEVFTRYFLQTGEWLSGVTYPGIVKILGAGYSAKLQQHHILMEYLPGGSMDDWLTRREILTPKRAIQVMLPLLDALSYLHKADRLHGAVHPNNVLFDAAGEPKLADFGIFKLPTEQVTAFRPLERIQSMAYSAPEALLGGRIGPASDLYSVGVLLYRCLTGRLPDRSEVRPPSAYVLPMPESLDQVLMRVLAMDQRKRHGDADELRDALALVLVDMGDEYDVVPGADAQQVWGFLGDISAGLRADRIREMERARAAGDWETVALVLQGLIDEIWDLGERVLYMLELARLFLEELDQPGRAVAIYRECIEWDPENRQAVDTLIGHYRREEDWEQLLSVYEDIAPGEEPERRRSMLEEMAGIAVERLDAPGRAARYLLELGRMRTAEPAWLDRAAAMQERAGDWGGAAETLQLLAMRLTGKREEQLQVLRHLAGLSREHLHDARRSIGYWEQIREAEPTDREAREQLQQLYKETFSYGALAELLSDVMSRGTGSRDEDIAVLQELGELFSSYLYDSKRAVEVWKQLLGLDPQSYTALSYLERLHLREGNHASYMEVLTAKAGLARDPREKADVLLTAAQTRERFFQDITEARRLLEQALEVAPGHPGVEAALERLYAEHGDADAQVDLLLSRLDRTEGRGERLDILGRLAEVMENVKGDADGALQVLQKMLLEAPEQAFLADAVRLAEAAEGGVESLGVFLSEHAGEVPRRTGGLWLRRAWELAEARGADVRERTQLLKRALEHDPDQPGLRERLIPVLREQEDWLGLARQIAVRVKDPQLDEDGRVELMDELARLCRERLDDGMECLELLEVALESVPAHAAARQQYAALLREAGGGERLQAMLEQDVRSDDPAIRQNARLELSALCTEADRHDEALRFLEAAFDADPTDSRVHERLEVAYSETKRWDRLTTLYNRLAAVGTDKETKVHFLEKAVTLQADFFENHEEAVAIYRQLIHLEPDRMGLYDGMETQLVALGRSEELVWLLEQRVGREKDDGAAVEILRRVAGIQSRDLDNTDAAISALRKALGRAPEDDDLMAALRELCVAHERWHALVRALQDQATRRSGDDKVEILLEMARVALERMVAPASAQKYVRQALGIRPDYKEAFDLSMRILEEQEDWKGMAEAIVDRLRVATDDERELLGMELARVNGDHLGREVEAVRSLERVLEFNPENLVAARRLADLYVRRQVWDKAAPLFQMIIEREEAMPAEERIEVLLDAARAFETILQRDAAIGYYREVIGLAGGHGVARFRLVKLLYLEQAWEEVGALAAEVVGTEGLAPDEQREISGILSDVEQRLGRAGTSRENLERLLESSPGDTSVLERLVDSCASKGDGATALLYQRRLLGVETDPERRFAHYLTLGDMARAGGDLDMADEAFREAAELRPDARVGWVKCSEVALQRQDFQGALEALEKIEGLETEPAARAVAAMTQGVILSDYLENPEAAASHFERALDADPRRLEAFERLDALAVDRGDWGFQRGIYERQLGRIGDAGPKELRRTLHQNLAVIALEKHGDEELSRKHLEKALALSPGDLKVRERLASLTAGADEHDKAVELYRDLVRRDPRNMDYLRQLRRLYSSMRMHDRAWCVAGILVALKSASDKESQFYQRFTSAALKLKPVTLTLSQWADLVVADEEDWSLSEVLRILYERIGGRLALPSPKEAGFSKRHKVDPTEGRALLAIIEVVAQVFGVQAAEVYLGETITGLSKESTMPPCLVAGKDMLEGRRGKEIRYAVGRNLSLFLPHHALAGVLDRDNLKILLLNTMKFIFPNLPEPPGDPKHHIRLRKEMAAAFRPRVHEELKGHIGELRKKGGEISLARWLGGVEKTACRAGLIICNDMPLASALIQNQSSPLARLKPEELVDDLILYMISDDYATVRELLGITIM